MKRVVVFSFCLLVAAACASTGTADPAKTPQDYRESALRYLPLAVGNSWTYTVDYLGQTGEMTIRIEREENGWFIDNRGTALTADRHGIRDRDRYLLTFPLQEKRAWVALTGPTRNETRAIVAIDAPVETPAGNFEGAIVVETTVNPQKGIFLKSLHYFVPRIGIVKIETFIDDTTAGTKKRQTLTLLKSLEIKNDPKH